MDDGDSPHDPEPSGRRTTLRILIANDDGIYSPGIAALAAVARRFGDVRVVAPDVEQSSAGHSITASKPLWYRKTKVIEGIEAYRVNGTPADCVALGTFHWDKIDLVLSGINLGPNLGNAMWHSGTLAAAKQAVLLGIRGIAFSTIVVEEECDFEVLTPWVERVFDLLLPLDDIRLINVNLPPQPKGMVWTRQAVKRYDGQVVPDEDPMGRTHFWLTVKPLEENEPGTDLWAMERQFVSMTPLRLDLTDHESLARLEKTLPLDTNDAIKRRPVDPQLSVEAAR
jgi:5'-nucleotidase